VVGRRIVAALVRRVPPGAGLAVRQSLLLAAGFGLALLLLLPWSGRLLTGAAFAGLGRPLATPGLADLLQLRPGGGGVPGPLVGPVYPRWPWPRCSSPRRAPPAGLLAARGVRGRRPAGRLAGQGLAPEGHRLAGRAAGAGAVAWAAAAGLGLAGSARRCELA
jgi:hypothetical protein